MTDPSLKLSFKLKGDDFRGFIKESDKSTRSFTYVLFAFLLFGLTVALYLYVIDYVRLVGLDEMVSYGAIAAATLLLSGLYLILTRAVRRAL